MPKKRNHGDGALYRIPSKALWRGVIDVGFQPDGRRKQKYVTARTQTAARAKLEAIKKDIAEYGTPIDRNMTVEAWAEKWLTTVCEPTMKPAALQGYESAVRRWILPKLRKKAVAAVRPSDVREVVIAVTDAGRKPSSAHKVHAVLSSMLEAALEEGLTTRNVAKSVSPPALNENARDSLETEIALRVLQAALNHSDGSRWWFAILAGMRQGERLGATIDSPDLEHHEFTVMWSLTAARFRHGCPDDDPCGKRRAGACPQRQLRIAPGMHHRALPGGWALVPPKSGKPRTFPMIEALEKMLTTYLENDTRPNPHGLIWHNDDGSPIDPDEDQAAWRALLLEAGVITPEQALPPSERPEGTPPTPTTHFARHTTATVLMELGVDAKVIGEIVGHAAERTTRRYQHVSSAAARQAMQAIGDHFQKALLQ